MANDLHSQESSQCGWSSPHELPPPLGQSNGTELHLAPQLVQMIEGELVPRLLLMRRPKPVSVPDSASAGSPFTTEQTEELARLLVTHESSVAYAYVEMFRQNALAVRDICLHLLPAAARHLGKLWEEDRCSFAEVTMGVSSLHRLLHWLTSDEESAAPQVLRGMGNAVLLSCMPGEQHTFGVLVVAQFLRRAGWNVLNLFPANNAELLQSVKKKSFTLVGLSIGRYSRIRDVTALIKALRRGSKNPDVAVIVGGPILALRPQICRQVGADATGMDAQETVNWAQKYWQSMAPQI